MPAAVPHSCQVLPTPWQGIHVTRMDSGRHFGRHWHADHGFGFIEQGAHASASGRGPVEAFAGDVLATNPGEVHDGRPLGGSSRRWHMVFLDTAALAAQLGLQTGFELTRPVIRDAALHARVLRLLQILERWRRPPAGGAPLRMACDEALAEACGALLQRHSTIRGQPAPAADLTRLRERLADECLDPPSLDELAAMAGLSRYQVLRRFRSAFGLPPHAWLLAQRAERARGLIRRGAGLAAAASDAGFADQSHMTRTFVRSFGYTPGAWLKAR